MKLQTVLILSVGLNLSLGAYVLLKPGAPEAAMDRAPAAVPSSVVAEPSRTRTVVQTEVVVNEKEFGWNRLESEDYQAYIDNLRSVGCPEETIRDIIIADVNKLYAGRIAALYPSPKDFKWWETRDRRGRQRGESGEEERTREESVRALEREKREVIRTLLGVDMAEVMEEWEGRPGEDDFRYGFLTPEKAEALKTLREKIRDEEREMWRSTEGLPEEERRAKLAAMRQSGTEQMKALLSPQEYEEYQLRNSGTARGMRERLTAFEPSQTEFSEIFKLQSAFDEQYGGDRRGGGDEASRQARDQARAQLDEQLKAVLGLDRFEEYKLAQDDRYREVFDFTEQNELPKETAKAMYDYRRIAEDQRRQVLGDETILPEDKAVILSALAEETGRTLQATLGADAFNKYAERDGRWLRGLATARTDGGDRGRGGEQRGRGGDDRGRGSQ